MKKLKHINIGLKKLNTADYKKIGEKVKDLRDQIAHVQDQMRDHLRLANHDKELRVK